VSLTDVNFEEMTDDSAEVTDDSAEVTEQKGESWMAYFKRKCTPM
jgi:hypothetical protein